ncbi:hypothetical protein SAMN05216474_1887 [Lishizhenia tianjinensis]|uniref:Uncharacterized protein n=1 Tax=Lishizhenia tianjinensis TaxID=477690 RepID=A0A1I7A4H4_9FLAO|nr:hypothetical protein [Lishizhenia tianjinensis]SFT69833.1 hypothetical protein SAMN05216474_1887 [Lishizhenia tianjinensis]
MKTNLLLLFLFCLNITAFAQEETPSSIPFIAYWTEGEVYSYELIKTKIKETKSSRTVEDSLVYTVTFEILEETDTSYTISYTQDPIYINGLKKEMLQDFKHLLTQNIIYETDETGLVKQMRNAGDVLKTMKENMETIFSLLSTEYPQTSVHKLNDLKTVIDEIFTEENIMSLAFKELTYFHFPFGYEFDTNGKVSYEDLLPNPFGGSPLRGDAEISISEVDAENMSCVLSHNMTVNPEDVNRFIKEFIEKLNTNFSESEKLELNDIDFQITDNNAFTIDYDLGLPLSIQTSRRTTVKEKTSTTTMTEGIKLQLIDAE